MSRVDGGTGKSSTLAGVGGGPVGVATGRGHVTIDLSVPPTRLQEERTHTHTHTGAKLYLHTHRNADFTFICNQIFSEHVQWRVGVGWGGGDTHARKEKKHAVGSGEEVEEEIA